jgi:hypothetical protein
MHKVFDEVYSDTPAYKDKEFGDYYADWYSDFYTWWNSGSGNQPGPN